MKLGLVLRLTFLLGVLALVSYALVLNVRGFPTGVKCDERTHCRGLCLELAADGYCSQLCQADRDCPAGFTCFDPTVPARYGHVCVRGPLGEIGAGCWGATQCRTGFCTAWGYMFGMCTQPCDHDKPCPAGAACAPLSVGFTDPNARYCQPLDRLQEVERARRGQRDEEELVEHLRRRARPAPLP